MRNNFMQAFCHIISLVALKLQVLSEVGVCGSRWALIFWPDFRLTSNVAVAKSVHPETALSCESSVAQSSKVLTYHLAEPFSFSLRLAP